jgi:hypothetical protein
MKTQLLNLQNGMRSSDATFVLLKGKMKGLAILLSIMLLMTFSMKSFAQITSTTAGWGTTVNPNVQFGPVTAYPATIGAAWGGALGANSASISNTYTYTSDASAWLSPGKITGAGSGYNPNAYIEYKVAPKAGNSFNIGLIRFTAACQGTSGGKLVAYYSIDNDANSFANPTDLGTASLGSSPVTRYATSTIANPMSLIRTDSIGGRTYPMDITGSHDITYTPNITVPDGKFLSLRVYAWTPNSPAKNWVIRNVVMTSGASWPVATVATTTATSVTSTSASLSSSITSANGEAITASGFVYTDIRGTLPFLTYSNVFRTITSPIVVSGALSANLIDLKPGVTYYARSYATGASSGTSYGQLVSFTTPVSTLSTNPLVTTTPSASGSGTSATAGGTVSGSGGSSLTACGVVWSTASIPASTDISTITNKTNDVATTTIGTAFTSSITGLTANTKYFARAYATNSTGTTYGQEITFYSASGVAAPTVVTTGATVSAATTATFAAEITGTGTTEITANGFVWATTTAPTTANSKVVSTLAKSGVFTGNLTSLVAGTTYYVRAYVTNLSGTFYGNEIILDARLSTTAAASVTANSATLAGNILALGGSTLTAAGVVMGTATAPTLANTVYTLATAPTATGVYTMPSVTGLTAATKYFVRAYATTASGTIYGNEVNFSTADVTPAVLPTLTTNAVATASTTSIITGGTISSNGNGSITTSGVVWSTASGATVTAATNAKTTDGPTGGVTGTFNSTITAPALPLVGSMAPGSTYYIRAYATNAAGTAYGNEVTFNYPASIPTLSTTAVSSITTTSATIGGTITANNGSAITASGLVWSLGSVTTTPTLANTVITSASPDAINVPFSAALTGLTPGTVYYYRPYATNAAGTNYGTATIITTTANPVLNNLTTAAVTNITESSASSGANVATAVAPLDVQTLTETGLVWGTATAPTTALTTKFTTSSPALGDFTGNLTGLTGATVYYVRSYAIYSDGAATPVLTTIYGNELSFTTSTAASPVVPSLTTFSPVTVTSLYEATTGGTITSTGGSPITGKGLVWSTSPIPDGADITTYTTKTLSLNTSTTTIFFQGANTYYLRAYATNSAGTGYGNQVVFNVQPTANSTAVDLASITNTGASVSTNINNPNSGATITEYGFVYGTAASPTTANTKVGNVAANTASTTLNQTLSGLTAGTTYYVRSYITYALSATPAVYGASTVYSNQVSFTTNPSVATAPVLAASTIASLITQSSGRSGGSITATGGAAITESGIVWATTTGPTTASNKVVNSPLVSNGEFIADIAGLNPGTAYYVRAYATNSVGTTYGTEISFTTLKVAPVLASTIAASNIADVTATVGGDVTSTGGTSNITENGIVYSTSANPTIASSKTAGTLVTAPGQFSVNLTGLTASTTYYARSYITTPGFGTFYGSEVSFTTTATVLPLKITSFTAKAIASGVALKWTTASEVNVKGFEVERRTANTNFASVSGLVAAGLNTYSYIDQNVQNEVYYYRIKAIDQNGDVNYSEIAVVTFNLSSGNSVVVYPNPTTDKINVVHQAATAGNTISILGLNGVTYNSTAIKIGDTQTTLDVSALTPGIYIVVINQNNKRSTIKFVKN